jgi:hypothetical protein
VYPRPFLWDESRALDFFDLYDLVCAKHPLVHPVSRELIMLIFFEETAFANVKQDKGRGPAVGFGQMEIYNKDKIPFFEWLGYNSDVDSYPPPNELPNITPDMIVSDYDLSVLITCSYFQWLCDENGKSTVGALQAQTGGGANLAFVPLWLQGEVMLNKAFDTRKRDDFIKALNHARANGPHANPVNSVTFATYWDFTLPEDGLAGETGT